jgi:hypothetical protein
MKRTRLLFIAVFALATGLFASPVFARETVAEISSNSKTPDAADKKSIDVSITTGVRLMSGAMWGFIPFPLTADVTVDSGLLRLRVDGGYHHFATVGYGIASVGAVFTPTGKNAKTTGGFQLKIPLLADVGFMAGNPEAFDGYDEDIKWLLLGPSTGADFIWWKAQKLGFTISVKAGYQFRVNIGSKYKDGYSRHEDTIGNLEGAVLFGVTI